MTGFPSSALWRTELRLLLKLALPLCAVQFGTRLMGFVDVAVVGRLGKQALAAAGIGNAVFFCFAVVGLGIVMGLDPLISQALGAGRPERAHSLLWQGFWVCLLTCAVLSPLILLAGRLFGLFGIEFGVASEARAYLWIRLAGLLPFLCMHCVRAYLQGTGHTRPLVVAVVLGNVANLVLTIALVFGVPLFRSPGATIYLLPPLGVAGSALATVLGQLLQLGIVVYGLPGRLAKVAVPQYRPHAPDIRATFRLGVPVGLQLGAEVGLFTLFGLLAGRLGTLSLAAHQVALTLASMSFVICIGLANAASVRVGRAIGAQDTPRARRAGLLGVALAVAVMASSALCLLLIPERLAAILSDKPDVIARAAALLGLAALFQVSDGIQAVGAGILRGAGDTRIAFLLNLVGHYAVGLPVGLLLAFTLALGVEGLWIGLIAGLSVVAIGLLARFLWLSRQPIRLVEAVHQG